MGSNPNMVVASPPTHVTMVQGSVPNMPVPNMSVPNIPAGAQMPQYPNTGSHSSLRDSRGSMGSATQLQLRGPITNHTGGTGPMRHPKNRKDTSPYGDRDPRSDRFSNSNVPHAVTGAGNSLLNIPGKSRNLYKKIRSVTSEILFVYKKGRGG